MVLSTLPTRQPWCVQTAEKALISPALGWVTTTFWSLKILPPPTGMSLTLANASAGGAALSVGDAAPVGDALSVGVSVGSGVVLDGPGAGDLCEVSVPP